MKTPIKILLGTAAALALLRKRAPDAETGADETDAGADGGLAMTGFSAYESELMARGPVDLGPLEDIEPMCGSFYQTRRGDTWLGDHERSITYRALFRSTFVHATRRGASDPEQLARRNAANPRARKQLFDLCVGQQWADEVYGTYLLSSRDPVGPHGRGIPLVRSCFDNRARILQGEAVVRIVPRGEPGDRGLGVPSRKMLHNTRIGPVKLAYPFVWLPMLHPDELLVGRVTTRRMAWDDGSTALEPPPVVWNLRIAELDHG
jgi:hypothetical protein